MFKQIIGNTHSTSFDLVSTTTSKSTNQNDVATEKTNKTISIQDGYKAKVYLLSQYPALSPHKLIGTGGNNKINVGKESYIVSHSLNQTTVKTTGISTTIANQALFLTKSKDAKNTETATAICTYVYLYTQYGGMF